MIADLQKLVPVPPASSINTQSGGPCPTSDILRRRGLPVARLTKNCVSPTNAWWRAQMVTESVGPFRVTGFRPAVALLRAALADVKAQKPLLYSSLGSVGMLCCRHVRGVPGLASNHSFGMAIDFTIGGKLDRRGDDLVQAGLLDLYSVLKRHGWFWGAGYRTEDAHHFEAGRVVVQRWISEGVL